MYSKPSRFKLIYEGSHPGQPGKKYTYKSLRTLATRLFFHKSDAHFLKTVCTVVQGSPRQRTLGKGNLRLDIKTNKVYGFEFSIYRNDDDGYRRGLSPLSDDLEEWTESGTRLHNDSPRNVGIEVWTSD